MAQEMAETILNDFNFEEGKEVAVMLSSLGATPVMELYVLYDEVEKVLAKAGHKVWKTYIGNYVTSLDMNGASLTIVDLDDEIKRTFIRTGSADRNEELLDWREKKMKLQLALDEMKTEEAIKLVEKVKDYIDIIEVGTPMSGRRK